MVSKDGRKFYHESKGRPNVDRVHPILFTFQRIRNMITTATAAFVIESGSEQTFDGSSTEVDAETGSGTGEYAPWFNALQKAVITKLSAMTGNASTVFTIV